jgi:hypothetical protein
MQPMPERTSTVKTNVFGFAISSLLASAMLSGCVVEGIATVTPARVPVVVGGSTASTTTVITHDDDWGYGDYDTGYGTYGSYDDDDTVIVVEDDSYGRGRWRNDSTTVITTTTAAPAPVVYGPPVVVKQPAPAASENADPIIHSFTANPSNVVPQGQPITFTVVANDPNNKALQFNWSSTGGTLSTNAGRVVSWTPPEQPGIYTVSTVITNGDGGVVTGSQNLTVMADGRVKQNPAPTQTASL